MQIIGNYLILNNYDNLNEDPRFIEKLIRLFLVYIVNVY